MNSTLRAERHDSLLVLHLESPDHYPRLTRSVLRALRSQFDSLSADSSIHAVLITGTDRAFAAGADIAEVGTLTAVEAMRFSAFGQSAMRCVERSPKPVVAAIRGFCLGGGFDLAMSCHLRVAATDARFAHPGGALGLITGWGGTARLPRIVSRSRAMEMLATGRMISAREAFAWGLVNRLVEPQALLSATIDFANQLQRL